LFDHGTATSNDGHCVFYSVQLKLKSIETEQFPAKTMMKWSPKVLEHRRQAFEKYLQVYTCDHHVNYYSIGAQLA